MSRQLVMVARAGVLLDCAIQPPVDRWWAENQETDGGQEARNHRGNPEGSMEEEQAEGGPTETRCRGRLVFALAATSAKAFRPPPGSDQGSEPTGSDTTARWGFLATAWHPSADSP